MTIVLSAALIVFGVMVLLLLGSQIELYRNVQQLREYSGLVDRPIPIELPARTTRPSSAGLPAHLDTAVGAVVLFLSDKCSTCRSIAAAMDGAVPRNLTLVLDAGGDGDPSDLAITYQLAPERTVVDLDRNITTSLNIKITPSAAVIENGRLVRATTVPSTRQLYSLLESVRVPQGPAETPAPSIEGKDLP